MIADAASRRPMIRGAGNSIADTFAVFVPLADWRWSQHGPTWAYTGQGGEAEAIDGILEALRL